MFRTRTFGSFLTEKKTLVVLKEIELLFFLYVLSHMFRTRTFGSFLTGKKILVVPADFHPSFIPFSCIMNLHQFRPFEVLPGFERGLRF